MGGRHVAKSQSALTQWTRLAAVVPLVLMTGAWTAAIATTSAPEVQPAIGQPDVPTTAFAQPASNPSPLVRPLGVDPKTGATGMLSTLDATGIPGPTVTAYKRAESVLAGSDASCKLPWTLIAAIGRVESNHGRYGGSKVDVDGVSTPGIYGIALDGSNNTARITDSDNGALDRDKTFDRAVGPMQFIPSTWRAVAVDGDNDGSKDPQDINDAALATGIYLCSGADDVSTPAGAGSAVLRYNHSNSYVSLVLSIAARYAAGDFDSTELPSSVVPADNAPAPKEPSGDDTVTAAGRPATTSPAPKTAAAKPDPKVTSSEPSAKPEPPADSTPTKRPVKNPPAAKPTPSPPTATPTEPPASEPPAEPCYVDQDGKAVELAPEDVPKDREGCLPPCDEVTPKGEDQPTEPCRNRDDDTVVAPKP